LAVDERMFDAQVATTVPDEAPVPAVPDVAPVLAPDVEPAAALPDVAPVAALPEAAPVPALPEVDPVAVLPDVAPVTALPDDEPAVALPEVEPVAVLPDDMVPEVAPDMSTVPDAEPDDASPDAAPVAAMSPEAATPLDVATPELGCVNPASTTGMLASPVAHAAKSPAAKVPKRQTPPLCIIAHHRMTYLKSTDPGGWLRTRTHWASAPLGDERMTEDYTVCADSQPLEHMEALPRTGGMR
jgi:hypothetical protein